MPSVDPDTAGSSVRYPSSPPGPPPPGRAVDSPDRRGPSSHGSYGYVPGAYGGGGSGPPPSTYYPMAPPPHGNYPPQPPPPQQQAYPGYGNPTPGPYLPYRYNGPPWMSYDGAPPGFYPSQRMPPVANDKVPSPSRSGATNVHSAPYLHQQSTQQQQQHQQDSTASGRTNEHALSTSLSDTQQQELPNLKHMHTAEELDRLKAAAVVELGLSEVKPIQSDFHFFATDHKKKLLPLAIAEVDQKLQGKSTEFIRKHRTFLIHSNLNCRVMKAWEDLPRNEREDYFKAEEDDRHRFMDEDEVVSRHCFTLTARVRSPNKSKDPVQFDNDDDDGPGDNDENDRDEYDDNNDEHHKQGPAMDDTTTTTEGKRLPDEPAVINEESPAKKNKVDPENSEREEHATDVGTDTQRQPPGE